MSSRRHTLLDHLPAAEQALVSGFFGAFATAEHDLKVNGFIRRGSEDAGRLGQFATAIRQRFRVDRPRAFAKAWRILTADPPRKQVVQRGQLGWKITERPKGASDAEWGLLLVRRVRNNLFHGAKFMLGGSNQRVRDRDLVKAAHAVLEMAMALSPPLRRVTRV
jgi:hypothetical protein